MKKKPMVLGAFLAVLFSMAGSSFAAPTTNVNAPSVKTTQGVEIPQSGIQQLSNGAKVYYGTDAMNYVKSHHISTKGKVVKIVHVEDQTSSQNKLTSNTITPNWFGTGIPYVTNLSPTEFDGTNAIGSTSGSGTISLQINNSYAAKWSASGGISAEGVTAGVGFDVTTTYGVVAQDTENVPAGHRYSIVAYPTYSGDNFDVYVNPPAAPEYKAGSGYAVKPIGADFVVSTVY